MKTIKHVGQLAINRKSFPRLVEDLENYLEKKLEIYSSITMFNSIHWYDMLQTMSHILNRYYNIEEVEGDFYYESDITYSGGFVGLTDKYIKKFIEDVYEVYIDASYPQRIDKLIRTNKLWFSDKKLKFIYHILYKYVKQSTLRKLFINYTYGIMVSNKSKIYSNLDLRIEVSDYYNKLFKNISEQIDYIYIDTDTFYVKESEIEKIMNLFLDNEITEYNSDGPYDYIFFRKKTYIKFDRYTILKKCGIRENENPSYY